MLASNQPQKWEYAHIMYYSGSSNTFAKLTYLRTDGPKTTVLKKNGMFSGEPDYWKQIRTWITQLGQEGYEMVNYANAPNHNIGDEEFWFKRPL